MNRAGWIFEKGSGRGGEQPLNAEWEPGQIMEFTLKKVKGPLHTYCCSSQRSTLRNGSNYDQQTVTDVTTYKT